MGKKGEQPSQHYQRMRRPSTAATNSSSPVSPLSSSSPQTSLAPPCRSTLSSSALSFHPPRDVVIILRATLFLLILLGVSREIRWFWLQTNRPLHPALVVEKDEERGWLPQEQLESSSDALRMYSKAINNPKAKALIERRKEQLNRLRAKYGHRLGKRLAKEMSDPLDLLKGGNGRFPSLIKDAKDVTERSPRLVQKYAQQEYQPLSIAQPNADPQLQTFIQTHHDDCADKEHMLRQLKAANITLTPTICQQLPTWTEVTELYGSGPVVLGLETCSDYRDLLRNTHYSPQATVAGLWNSGTTALSMLFLRNLIGFYSSTDVAAATVPWGKHIPLYLKYSNRWPIEKRSLKDKEMKDHVLPVLIVRDPFRWMKTMCRKQYDAMWQFGWKNRCPNFIPTKKERESLNLDNTTFKVITNPAQTNHRRFTKYDSLAELWSSFNEEYLYSEAPRLIIRAEDTFLYPKQLLEIISNCSGMPLKRDIISNCSGMPLKRDGEEDSGFRYFGSNSTKGGTADWLQAMEKYGRKKGRFPGTITSEEKGYLQSALSPTLMKLLHYPQIPASGTAVGLGSGEEAVRKKKLGS